MNVRLRAAILEYDIRMYPGVMRKFLGLNVHAIEGGFTHKVIKYCRVLLLI